MRHSFSGCHIALKPIKKVILLLLLIHAALTISSSSEDAGQPTGGSFGVLKGKLTIPLGLFRGQPFILAYSATYGEKVIPVEEKGSIAKYEVRLKPGVYYIFVALDGYEPTCHVAEVDPDKVVEYNPRLGAPLEIKIKDYFSRPEGKVETWQAPIVTRPISPPQTNPRPPQ